MARRICVIAGVSRSVSAYLGAYPAAMRSVLRSRSGNSRGVRRLPGRKLFWPEELPDVVAEEARALWG